MKTNNRLILTVVILAGFTASQTFADKQLGTNAAVTAEPPALVAPTAEPAPEPAPAKPAKKKTAKKAAPKAKAAKRPVVVFPVSAPLNPGPATVAAKAVNVRGQPTVRSEVVTRLTNGESVTVIEEIHRENTRADDPDAWAKIALPASAHLWVSGQFVDSITKTVSVKKLNLRTGPGENYSVAGVLLKGDTVKDVSAKAGWLEVEAPANAYAYVAAAYLRQESSAAAPVEQPAAAPAEPTPAEPAPTPTPVAETTLVAEPPTAEIPTSATPTPGNELVPVSQLQNSAPTPAAPVATPAPEPTPVVAPVPTEPRIVEREGIVRRTWSIIAPTPYKLASPESGVAINYLYTTSTNLDLSRYKGMRIIVTGEEGLDQRWESTPVITIRKIQVVE